MLRPWHRPRHFISLSQATLLLSALASLPSLALDTKADGLKNRPFSLVSEARNFVSKPYQTLPTPLTLIN